MLGPGSIWNRNRRDRPAGAAARGHAFETDLARPWGVSWAEPTGGGPRRGSPYGYLLGSAFTFYYPENLEALEEAGVSLLPISAIAERELPRGLSALYIGGGFRRHASALTSNAGFLDRSPGVGRGLPVYAECGGLMLLSAGIWWQQRQ